MIAELFRYWTTFAPERVRKFGYLKRLIALEFRAKRCEIAWADHRENCKRIIIKAADLCEKQDICVIIGSGLLLEVPLSELSSRFRVIYLADMFHMPQVVAQARKHFNVKLLSGDVTGVFQAIKDRKPPGGNNPIPPPRIPHLKDADLVVSCNCLTQLAGPFTEYFEKERGFTEHDSDKVAAALMERHAKAIAEEVAGVGVIITDVERYVMAGSTVVTRTDLLKGIELPVPLKPIHNEEWSWLIAPAGEDDPNRDIEHQVEAKIYTRMTPEEEAKAAAEKTIGADVDDRPAAPDEPDPDIFGPQK